MFSHLRYRNSFVAEIRFASGDCITETLLPTRKKSNQLFFSHLFQNFSSNFSHNPAMDFIRCSSKPTAWSTNKIRTCSVTSLSSSRDIFYVVNSTSRIWWTNSSTSFIRRCSPSSTVTITLMKSKFDFFKCLQSLSDIFFTLFLLKMNRVIKCKISSCHRLVSKKTCECVKFLINFILLSQPSFW